jgi:enoyl-CoA hydratase/carnithine racemase
MMVQLEEAISKLESWTEGKGLLIYGAEDNFCSGGDLNFAQKTGSPEGGYKMATFMQNALIRLQQLNLISVAFIDGFGKWKFVVHNLPTYLLPGPSISQVIFSGTNIASPD